jgi:hypothetical protein
MRGDVGEFLRRFALAYGLVALLLLAVNAGAMLAMRFPDPDDTLRLVQVRDLLAGQGWFDMTAHRIDPLSGGVPMHWSRVVDVPIAAVVLVLRPLLGPAGADMAALVLVPMMTLAVVMALVARVAWERLGREACSLSCLVLAMAVPVMAQIRPMRIDHHGWQIATTLLAMNGLMTRHARLGGWISGAAMAIGLSISLESLPMVAVLGAIGAWRWLRGGDTARWLVHFAQSLAVVALIGFAATRGLADLAQHCDALAPVHLVALGWVAVALRVMAPAQNARVAIAGFAIIGAGALALYLGIAPQCRAGSFNMLDPLVRQLWYDQVSEGLPIWQQDWTTALQIVVPGLFGLLGCWQLIGQSADEERVWWQEYGALLAGALAVAMGVARAGAVAAALGAVPLAWLVGTWLASAHQAGAWHRRLAALLGIGFALVPSAPITLWGMVPHGGGGAGAPSALGSQPVSACGVARQAGALGLRREALVLAPLDIGPELLLSTPASVLATGHHRGASAMHDVIASFTAPPPAARTIIARRHITHVALCDYQAEASLYAQSAPDGLAAALMEGHPPAWLTPLPGPGPLRVWRVNAAP